MTINEEECLFHSQSEGQLRNSPCICVKNNNGIIERMCQELDDYFMSAGWSHLDADDTDSIICVVRGYLTSLTQKIRQEVCDEIMAALPEDEEVVALTSELFYSNRASWNMMNHANNVNGGFNVALASCREVVNKVRDRL